MPTHSDHSSVRRHHYWRTEDEDLAAHRQVDFDDEMPIPAAMPVGFPDMAPSSQTVPSSEPEINFSQIMEAVAAIQRGMSTMQQSITSMQQEVRSINKWTEQTQLDLRECLKYHHPDSSDDEEVAPRTAPMAEDDSVSFCYVLFETFCYVLFVCKTVGLILHFLPGSF